MKFLDAKELTNHAMKCRYGWRRFFMPVPSEIKADVHDTITRIQTDAAEFEEHQARLDFIRKYPIKD